MFHVNIHCGFHFARDRTLKKKKNIVVDSLRELSSSIYKQKLNLYALCKKYSNLSFINTTTLFLFQRKEKTLTNSALYKDLINLIPSVINVEKSYSELGFLSARSKVSLRKDVSIYIRNFHLVSHITKTSHLLHRTR